MQSNTIRDVSTSSSPKSSAAPSVSETQIPFIGVCSRIVPPRDLNLSETCSRRREGDTPRFNTSGVKHSYPMLFSKYPPTVGAAKVTRIYHIFKQ